MRVDPRTWTVTDDPKPLTFGADNNESAHALPDGRVVFIAKSSQPDLWQMPVQLEEGKRLDDLKQLTKDRYYEIDPSITPDGKSVLYSVSRDGDMNIFVRDLANGTERAVTTSRESELYPKVSPDGKMVAYRIMYPDNSPSSARVVPIAGGAPQTICDRCGYPFGWTHDSGAVIMHGPGARGMDLMGRSGTNMLRLYDVQTKKMMRVLEHPTHMVSNPKVSPNGRWLAFAVRIGPGYQLTIAPWKNAFVPVEEYVPLTDAVHINAKPFWSPSGRMLYYVSSRDGNLCLYAQRMNPETGKSVGESFPVQHMDRQRSLSAIGLEMIGITGAGNSIVFNMVTAASDIWLLEP